MRYITVRPETTEAAELLRRKLRGSVCRADDWNIKETLVVYHNEEGNGSKFFCISFVPK